MALPLRITRGAIITNRRPDRVTISWRTNRPADGYVDLGTSSALGQRQGLADVTQDHEITLSDLEPGTLYHIVVGSTDPAGNEVSSDDRTLTTRPEEDVVAPFLTQRPEVVGVTDSSAYVRWRTNEPTDALVEYGPDPKYGETVLEEEFTADHKVSLTGLEPGTTYHVRVSCTDASGNGPVVSGGVSFHTRQTADLTPPSIIAGPGIVDLSSEGVTVRWRTDEPADGFVEYGAEGQPLSELAGSAIPARKHEVTLSNLAPGTRYEYRVRSTDLAGNTSSTDPAGNAAWSKHLTFTTRAAADTEPPVITRGPSVVVGNRGAVIVFRTNERCIAELAYGTSETLGTAAEEVVFEDEPRRRHRLHIGRLAPRTRYVFTLTCRDAAGNSLIVGTPRRAAGKIVLPEGADDLSGALEFTTEEHADTAPPVITSGPTLVSRSSDTAIIEWATDEPADSYVDFGVGGLASAVGSTDLTQEHRVILSGLEPSTAYSYSVRSTDFAGNPPVSSQTGLFSTAADPDISPPVLLAGPRLASIADDRAIVTWQSDEAASLQIAYGQGSLFDQALFDDTFATEHTIQLTGLQPDTVYALRVSLTDPRGNTTTADAPTFATTAAADVSAPVLGGVQVTEVADASAIVSWTTDEVANRFVYFGTTDALDRSAGQTDLGLEHAVMLTNLAPATVYQYQVESVDPAGNSSGRSDLATFTTAALPDTSGPEAPDLFEATMGLETARLSWTAATAGDLAGYTVHRSINGGPFQAVAAGLADTFYVDEGLVYGSAYQYHVSATDLSGNEGEATDQSGGAASVRNVPSAVVPISGANVGPVTTLEVSNAVPGIRGGALSYSFQVSTTELFDDVVASATGIVQGSGSTSWSFEKELEPGGEYFWRGRAFDGLFHGPWSNPSYFVAAGGAPGDFSGDGAVGFDDFFMFVDAFGLSAGDAGHDAIFDLNTDSTVGFDDFFLFVDVFGTAYSSAREVAASPAADRLEATVTSELLDDEVHLAVRAEGLQPARGVGLVVRFDPGALELLGLADGGVGVLAGLAPSERLLAVSADEQGEITLLAHRIRQHDLGDASSLAILRFRPRRHAEATHVELARAVVRTRGSIAALSAPVSARVRLVPAAFALGPNYPNPFNPATTIAFDVPSASRVELAVHDLLGQRVRELASGDLPAGRHRVVWDGRDGTGRPSASGAYFVTMHTGSFRAVRKMLLLR